MREPTTRSGLTQLGTYCAYLLLYNTYIEHVLMTSDSMGQNKLQSTYLNLSLNLKLQEMFFVIFFATRCQMLRIFFASAVRCQSKHQMSCTHLPR